MFFLLCSRYSPANITKRRIARQRLCHNLSQERPFFRHDEFMSPGEIEISDGSSWQRMKTVTDMGSLRDFKIGTM
jgi:hypothetical protein